MDLETSEKLAESFQFVGLVTSIFLVCILGVTILMAN
jgi:hypothetical protein